MMNILSFVFVTTSCSFLLWQLNTMTTQGLDAIGNSVNYITDSAKSGFKYSLTFIKNTHESRLDLLRKDKEKKDLERRIRIETIESELEEGAALIEKGMPNYHNLVSLFGQNEIEQYELASRIVMMKDTLFVSDSLYQVSRTVYEQLGDYFKKMNMKIIIDKMLEKEVFLEIQASLYEQQFRSSLLSSQTSLLGDGSDVLVLSDAFSVYESAWTTNIVNELLGAAALEEGTRENILKYYANSRYDLISGTIEVPTISINSPPPLSYKDKTNVNEDPKCLDPNRGESIWEQHNSNRRFKPGVRV